MRGRELRLALLLVLVGAGLGLLAAGRPWVEQVVVRAAPLPSRTVLRPGSDVVSALRPLALLGLAGVAALAATRGRGRTALGVLLGLAGVAMVVPAVRALVSPPAGATGWPAAAVAGGVLLAAGGLLVAVRGPRWAALSARYEAPAAQAEPPPARPEVAAWDALDRGEDPTAGADRGSA